MKHNSDIDAIEAGLERNRASLVETLSDLQDRASVEQLAADALGMVRKNAASYTASLDNAVRANPMAFALTGVGLLWLAFGSKQPADRKGKRPSRQALSRWEDEGAPPLDPTSVAAHHGKSEADEEWWKQADDQRRHATGLLGRIEAEVAKTRDSATGAYDTLRDFAGERAKVVADFTTGLQGALSHGLEDLSEEARQRVIDVREKAYGARLKTVDAVSDVYKNPGRVIEDHPLVVGAIALAMGAALGAALPRSRFEDRTFGHESDQLMVEAARMLREERDRYSAAAGDLAQTLKETANDGISDMAKATDAAKDGQDSGLKGEADASDTHDTRAEAHRGTTIVTANHGFK